MTQPASKPRSEKRRAADSAIGQHLLVDMYGIDAELLANGRRLTKGLFDALTSAGFHVIDDVWHKFPGERAGITAFFLLSESHAAMHTYPEYEYLALDIFSCGSANPEDVLRHFQQLVEPQSLETVCQARGNPKLLQPPTEQDTKRG